MQAMAPRRTPLLKPPPIRYGRPEPPPDREGRRHDRVTFAIALASAPAPALADIGPEPTMEEFTALAEARLALKLKKPRNVTFSWPYTTSTR